MVNPLNIIFVKRNMYVSIRLAASNRHSHQKKIKNVNNEFVAFSMSVYHCVV